MKTILAVLLLTASTAASAMLYCANFPDGSNVAHWSVGQPRDAFDDLDLDAATLECGASGNELHYLQTHFTGLHMRSLPSQPDTQYPQRGTAFVYFHGDDALFIVSNL